MQVQAFLSSGIGLVVACFVLGKHEAFLYHLVGGMALDLRES